MSMPLLQFEVIIRGLSKHYQSFLFAVRCTRKSSQSCTRTLSSSSEEASGQSKPPIGRGVSLIHPRSDTLQSVVAKTVVPSTHASTAPRHFIPLRKEFGVFGYRIFYTTCLDCAQSSSMRLSICHSSLLSQNPPIVSDRCFRRQA